MKLLSLVIFFISSLSQAAPWELCLDQGDFTLNVDALLKASKVSKLGCTMRFISFGAKGEKYELNLCDPEIHIKAYQAIDSGNFEKVLAGSAHCPKPLFGVDFEAKDTEPAAFNQHKQRIAAIFQNILNVYGEDAQKVDLNKIDIKSIKKADAQIACAKLLLETYLTKCIAMEEKPQNTTPIILKDLPPGVHPPKNMQNK